MPKRRGSSSPAAATKKSRKPPTRSASHDNGMDKHQLSPTESDLIVETASTSSSEDVHTTDQVSDDDLMDGNSAVVVAENGVSGSKGIAISVRPDWLGSLSIKQEFFEVFQLLCEPSRNIEEKEIVELFKDVFKRCFTDEEPNEKKHLVDQTLREYLLDKLVAKPNHWKGFLDFSIDLTREELCSPTAVIALLTDLVEVSRLNDCSFVFDYVESRLDVWKDPLFYTSGKNAVLRMCNDLLRRQSRAQNTVFCGRILIFLANYFPFSERSGLNIMSEFNIDNLTTYKTGDGTDDPDDKMEISEDSDEKLFEGMDLAIPGLDKIVSLTQEEKKRKIKVDYNLYVKFWSLQEYFRSPQDCYNKISWKTFTMYTQDVLGAFNSFKLDEASHRKRRERTEEELPSINPIPKLGDENLYFAKYLTNRRLLELQMSDPSFRRYFLVQLVVILQYLTVPVKFKSEAQILADDQIDFIKKTSEKIYELLAEIPPRGRDFVNCVKHILKREELWNKWKNDGCQPFKKPVPSNAVAATSTNVSEDDVNDKLSNNKLSDDIHSPSEDSKSRKKKKVRRQIGDSIRDACEKNKFLLGHTELTRLWNICPDNLEACRLKVRDFMPQLDVFFAEALKEMESDPTPMNILVDSSKKEFKQKKILGDAMFGWKALRLLARRSPYFFQMFGGAPISPLQNYLEYVLKKINADREPAPNSQEDNIPLASGKVMAKQKAGDPQANHDSECAGDSEQVMEAGTADDDELLRSEDNKDVSESGDEEEGEVKDKMVRPLTEDEQRAVAKALGDNWRKLGIKLGFQTDEVEYFAENHKEDAAFIMIRNWQEQDEDASAADLVYKLEGLKLKNVATEVFKM